MTNTTTALPENIAGVLCYVLGWISGVIFLILKPRTSFIRFHAIQSTIVFGVLFVAWLASKWIPVIGWLLALLVGILAFILWVVLMVRAYQGKWYKIPIAGNLAEKLMG
jgi:uncharacterized membrane protein